MSWFTYDRNPRVSYYKFLRSVYGLLAWEAYQRIKHWPKENEDGK